MFLAMGGTRAGEPADILLQPTFSYSKEGKVAMGKAFLVKGPEGKPFLITSAHLFYFYEEKLEKIAWADALTGDPIFESRSSVGNIGKNPSLDPMQLATDFAVFESSGNAKIRVLEIDPRKLPEIGEEIGVPYASGESGAGTQIIRGKITKATNEFIEAILDQEIKIRARSGSPILEMKNNKVIGILTGGAAGDGKSIIVFCGSSHLVKHLKENAKKPLVPLK